MKTFRRGVDIPTATTYELKREWEYEMDCLADDLRVCGSGYPSPLKPSLEAIQRELIRREMVGGGYPAYLGGMPA